MAKMTIRIDTGEITETTIVDDVPRQHWDKLTMIRRSFLKIQLPYDCRRLLDFVRDAERNRMWEALGLPDLDAYIREGLKIDPELARWAMQGLESLKPEWAVGFDEAVTIGKGQRLAADPTTTALEKPGAPLGNKNASKAQTLAADPAVEPSDRHRNKAQALAANPVVGPLAGNKRAKSTIVSRGSTQAEYLVRRLKRDAPEIAAALGRGEYRSARAAAIAAGIKRVPTALEACLHAWRKLTPEERQRFREMIDAEAAA